MKTATIKKAVTTSSSSAVVETALAETAAIYEVAEQILWNLGLDGSPTAAQREILRRAGIVDSIELERERGRVDAVKQLLARAGSREEMLAAERAALNAGKEYSEKAPALEAELARIQSELGALARARSAASHKLDAFNTARQHLRAAQMLPRFISEAYDADRRAANSNSRGKRIRELTSRIKLIEDLQNVDPGSQQAQLHCEAMEHLDDPSRFEVAARDCLKRTTSPPTKDALGRPNNQFTKVTCSADAFRGYRKRRLEEELPPLQNELDELRSQQSHALVELESQLDYYIHRIE